MQTNAKIFNQEILLKGPEYISSLIREDKQSMDINFSSLVEINEEDIANHVLSFNLEQIQLFDEMVRKQGKCLTMDMVFEFFKVKDGVHHYSYDNVSDYIEDLNELFFDMTSSLIGLFRYAVYSEEYEYAASIEHLIDEIESGKAFKDVESLLGVNNI